MLINVLLPRLYSKQNRINGRLRHMVHRFRSPRSQEQAEHGYRMIARGVHAPLVPLRVGDAVVMHALRCANVRRREVIDKFIYNYILFYLLWSSKKSSPSCRRSPSVSGLPTGTALPWESLLGCKPGNFLRTWKRQRATCGASTLTSPGSSGIGPSSSRTTRSTMR